MLVDPENGLAFHLDQDRGVYYGIARMDGKIFVAARRNLSHSSPPIEESIGEILVFDGNLRPTGALRAPFPLRDMHQILGAQGKLWVTCTFDNMIAIFDGTSWERWYPLGIPPSEPRDFNHFNSLALIDGELCILANNHGRSEILRFELPARLRNDSVFIGDRSHNVWKEGDRWMTCSSALGRIIGSDGFQVPTGGFPRGVALAEGMAYVGVSDRTERSKRDWASGAVLIFDRHWNQVGDIHLPHEGVILDLMVVDLPQGVNAAFGQSVRFPARRPLPG